MGMELRILSRQSPLECTNCTTATFDQARAHTGDVMISERAFTSALLAGDVQKAAALAPTGDDASESGKRPVPLTPTLSPSRRGSSRSESFAAPGCGAQLGHPHLRFAAGATPRERWRH